MLGTRTPSPAQRTQHESVFVPEGRDIYSSDRYQKTSAPSRATFVALEGADSFQENAGSINIWLLRSQSTTSMEVGFVTTYFARP